MLERSHSRNSPLRLSPVFSLVNKTALVTGSGSGIGAAIAEVFAEAGAQVFVADRDEAGARRTVAAIAAAGGSAQAFKLDITSEAEIAAARASIGGPLDILVNNAGVGAIGTILKTSTAELNRLIGVNVTGTFL